MAFIRGKWVIIWVSLLGSTLMAQTNEEVFREYQFNFSLPGARANAMGGAFIGLADDATSSFANPAGLAFLRETAFSIEYRNRNIDTGTGSISGSTNFAYEQLQRDISEVSFLSVNFRWKEWYFGVFQYRFLNENQEREFVSRSLQSGVETISAFDVALDLNGDNQGVGLARRIQKFKVGISLNWANMEARTRYTKEQVQIRPIFSEKFSISEIDESDHDLSWTLGVHHTPKDWLSWGAVARINPTFSLSEKVEERTNGRTTRVAEFDIPFVVPDVYGVGFRANPINPLSILLDWQYINYKAIIEDGFTIVESPESDKKNFYTIKNIQEIHLGAEYLLPQGDNVWALRGGYYRNPNHYVNYIGDDPVQAALFSRRNSTGEDYFTVGFGWGMRNQISLDVSANFWDQGSEYTASFIWRKK